MARYIDADIIPYVESENGVLDDFAYRYDINEIPTADVAPKSEEGAECPTCHGTGRIGTTDWLTKNISKEQIAKEKAEAIAEHELHIKQDYAMEIFEEIDRMCIDTFGNFNHRVFAELKKKYAEEKV